MGKKQKRGKAGNAAQYLTRNQAIKKLQLRLSEFRRLCILKGVHPREPKRKVKGANKTYYHVKDINWLAHEPLIQTFRAVKFHDRRVRKARAKQNMALARRLLANKPGYKLDHLIKERYPSFIDALRDLDDPLTLVHLFATLPGEQTVGIRPATVDKCRRLVLEWNAYIARTNSLRKVFVSVKGFYYQADVAGCSVTWLVPHQLSQVLPSDVDYTVMITFLEFYMTLLQFTLFKLYHNLGLRYPPAVDRQLESQAAGLAGIMRDIAGLAAEQQQQQQDGPAAAPAADGDQTAAAAAAAAAAAENGDAATVPDVVQRLGTLGKRIQELQQQQQQEEGPAAAAAAADEDSEELPDIDSGGGESEVDSEEADSDADQAGSSSGGSEDEDDSDDQEDPHSSSDDQQQQQQQQQHHQQQRQEEGSEDPDAVAADRAADPSSSRHGLAAAPAAAAAPLAAAAAAGGGLGSIDPDDDAGVCGVLLQGCVFYLAREVPREPLLFIIKAFGGIACWDSAGSPYTESDESITHQIVDRPTQGHKFLSRAYVQPQWLIDSVNFRVLLPVNLYAPGVVPPPHLSPFVDNEAEGYTPEFAEKVKQLQEAARAARRAAAGQAHEAAFLEDGQQQQQPEAAAAGEDDAAAEKVYRHELVKEINAAQGTETNNVSNKSGDDASADEGEQSEGLEDDQAAAAAAAKGKSAAASEEDAMADIMMTRKNRKLYARINRAIEGKAERVEALEKRKRNLAAAGGKQQQQQQQGSHKKKAKRN